MRIGDYFSGIGGFSVAAERVFGPGCVAYHCEKDAFARKILAKHWPNVPCYEDITQTDPATLPRADAVVGGWPCQGNSSAGKRKGHADARSGLFSELLRHVDGMVEKPRWVCFENVPGLVSVNRRRDFAEVILQLQRRGYVGCVRRLDAQYDGLAQRRARLLFVGGQGRAGVRAVQLITEGGKRYPAPRREKGQEVAGTLGGGSGERGWSDDTDRMSLVAQPLTGNGFEVSEDGTGRGTPLVAYQCCGGSVGPMGTLRAGNGNECGGVPFIARCDTAGEGSRQDGESCTFVVRERAGCEGGGKGPMVGEDRSFGLTAKNDRFIAESITGRGRGLDDGCANNVQAVPGGARRLTPTECERLQGFSWPENGRWKDGWTCLCGLNDGRSVATEGEPCKCPDGPRYRVLGNAAPPPMLEWIFRQIAAAEGA